LGATFGSLTPHGDVVGDAAKVIALEAILTFFLVTAVMAIGLVLTMDILAGGPLTGASMNPARTFGPALATNNLSYFWMYLVGPLLGGAIAGPLYSRYFMAADAESSS